MASLVQSKKAWMTAAQRNRAESIGNFCQTPSINFMSMRPGYWHGIAHSGCVAVRRQGLGVTLSTGM